MLEKKKEELLEIINRDIDNLLRRKKLIENLKIEPVDMEVWQELCETPIRYLSDLLYEIAEITFPKGKYFERNTDSMDFVMNGFEVSVPTCRDSYVYIYSDVDYENQITCLEDEKEILLKENNDSVRLTRIRKLLKLVDNKECDWRVLSRAVYLAEKEVEFDEVSDIKIYMWWNLIGKSSFEIEKYRDILKRNEAQLKKLICKIDKKIEKMKIEKMLLYETARELEKFGLVRIKYR